jgi:hypothetical protein
MNLQEREQLIHFLQQLNQAQAGQKDTEAEAMIRDAAARQPDAAYLLVQRSMQLEQALQMVQSQANKLQTELEQLRSGARSGFLDQGNAWGRPAAVQTAPGTLAQPQFQAQPQLQSQPQAQAPQAAAPASSWGSGMLGNVATTAAGVVAGSFLFQGIGNLMGHHQPGAGFGTGTPQPAPVAENTVINNYYDGSAPDDAEDLLASADAGDSGDSA